MFSASLLPLTAYFSLFRICDLISCSLAQKDILGGKSLILVVTLATHSGTYTCASSKVQNCTPNQPLCRYHGELKVICLFISYASYLSHVRYVHPIVFHQFRDT